MSSEELKSPLPQPTVHITTHNDSRQATIHSSKTNPALPYPQAGVVMSVAYTTSTMPVDLNDDADLAAHSALMSAGTLGLVNANGTVCRFVDFAPGNKVLNHRTQSLDYGVVLQGNMHMLLDDGSSTLIKQGDVAVQRATMHGWKNASETEWARMMFVLQDCKPVVVGGERMKEDLDGQGEGLTSGNDH